MEKILKEQLAFLQKLLFIFSVIPVIYQIFRLFIFSVLIKNIILFYC